MLPSNKKIKTKITVELTKKSKQGFYSKKHFKIEAIQKIEIKSNMGSLNFINASTFGGNG
jgi:hypothetical protein